MNYFYKGKKTKDIKDAFRRMGKQCLENIMEENQTKENPVTKWIRKNRKHLTNAFVSYDDDLGLKDPYTFHVQSLALGWLYGGVTLISDPTFKELVFNTVMPTKFPEEWLEFVPAWTVAVDLPNQPGTFFLGYRKFNEGRCIVIGIDTNYGTPDGVKAVNVYTLRLRDAGNGLVTFDYDNVLDNGQDSLFWRVLANSATKLLFLCTLIPPNLKASYNDVKFKEIKKNGNISYEVKPRERDVKVDITPGQVKYLKGFNTDLKAMQGIKHAKAAHIRRAHWRRYWVGPRNGERKRKLCWIPPTFVRGYVPHTQD